MCGYPWILTDVESNPGPQQMDRAAQEFQPGTMGYGALFVQPPFESENTTSTFEKLLILIQDIFKESHKSRPIGPITVVLFPRLNLHSKFQVCATNFKEMAP